MHPQIYHTMLLVHKRTIYAQNVINSTTWELKMIECLNKTVKNMQPIFCLQSIEQSCMDLTFPKYVSEETQSALRFRKL